MYLYHYIYLLQITQKGDLKFLVNWLNCLAKFRYIPIIPIFTVYGIAVLIFALTYNMDSTVEEETERLLYQKSITLNALPEYLILEEQIKIRDSIVSKLKTYLRDYDMDWLENVKKGSYDSFSLPLYFAAMGYEKEINQTDENLENYKILKNRYSEEIRNKQSSNI